MSQVEIKLQIGDILDGRYRVFSDGIAQDIGTRYTAYDLPQSGRLVDVLVLAARFGNGAELLERLTRANQAVADLAQPLLVPFEHVGLVQDGGPLYLVRRHLQGRTLSGLLEETGSLDSNRAVGIAIQVCNALAPAHRAGLVHGGLSPHSVLLGTDDQVLITDAGLAPALQPVPTPEGRPWGRFPYTSPEQASGEKAHPATDVYLLGSLLYEMLTGRTVFVAADETGLALQHLHQDPVPLQARVPQVPAALAAIVHRALAKEPTMRYRNAGQLSHILNSQLAPGSPVGVPLRPGRAAQQMTVPAPVVPDEVNYFELRETYHPDADTGEWAEESARANWLMMGLIVAALIAMLGLIPLWRTVYRRYALPPATPTPVVYCGVCESGGMLNSHLADGSHSRVSSADFSSLRSSRFQQPEIEPSAIGYRDFRPLRSSRIFSRGNR